MNDSDNGPADSRMGAYLEGHHHPYKAFPPRVIFVARSGDDWFRLEGIGRVCVNVTSTVPQRVYSIVVAEPCR